MTTSVFSTIDRLSSHVKPLDRLLTTVATRLLPHHEASGYSCDWPYHFAGFVCLDDFCNPVTDVRFATYAQCCGSGLLEGQCEDFKVGCDNCG